MHPPVCVEYEYPTYTPSNYFVSSYYDQLRPRRVVIVTPQSRSSAFRDQEKFAEEFAVQLRNAGIVDAVYTGTDHACNINAIRQGQFDEYQLVRLSQLYNADAVIYCDVVSMTPYAPLNASVSLAMVDARESVLLLAVDGNWDVRDPAVARPFKKFTCRSTRQDNFDSELRLQSPTEFLSFIAAELSQFIQTLQ